MTNADRQKRYRAKKRNAPVTESVTRVTPEPDRNAQVNVTGDMTPEVLDKLNRGCDAQDRGWIGLHVYYHPRTHPECLNWEGWMDAGELKANGFKANRVSIPGDWDYVGNC